MRSKIELMGIHEIATYMGVTRQAVSNWKARGHLPEPHTDLRMGPVWLKRDIEEFKQRRQP